MGPGSGEKRGAARAIAVVAGRERERGGVDSPGVGREALSAAVAAPVPLGCEPEDGSGERDQPGPDGGERLGAACAVRSREEDDAVVREARVPEAGGRRPTGRSDVGGSARGGALGGGKQRRPPPPRGVPGGGVCC